MISHICCFFIVDNTASWDLQSKYSKKLFLKDIYTKSWCGNAGVLDAMTLLLFHVLFQMYISIV